MRLSTRRKFRGLTLIEVLVTATLAAILFLIVTNMITSNLKLYHKNQKSIALEEKMAQVMREFEYSTRAASQIISADENNLVYLRYYDLASPAPVQVRYFVIGNQFEVGRTQPVGTPPNVLYPSENEEIVLLIEGLSNSGSLFSYYDSNGNLLPLPVDIVQTKMVELGMTLVDNGSNPPSTVSGSTRVNLRNMKTNL